MLAKNPTRAVLGIHINARVLTLELNELLCHSSY